MSSKVSLDPHQEYEGCPELHGHAECAVASKDHAFLLCPSARRKARDGRGEHCTLAIGSGSILCFCPLETSSRAAQGLMATVTDGLSSHFVTYTSKSQWTRAGSTVPAFLHAGRSCRLWQGIFASYYMARPLGAQIPILFVSRLIDRLAMLVPAPFAPSRYI